MPKAVLAPRYLTHRPSVPGQVFTLVSVRTSTANGRGGIGDLAMFALPGERAVESTRSFAAQVDGGRLNARVLRHPTVRSE